MIPRIYELWIGQQASGKTFALAARVRYLARHETRAVSSVWILDTTGEWQTETLHDAVIVRSWGDFATETADGLPRTIVFRDALEWVEWRELAAQAQGQGRIALVLDEAYVWLPARSDLDPDARRVILAGRHLPALDRQLEPLHILAACQYPRSVHHLLHEQASGIYVGRIEGELSTDWVRGNFGREATERVARLSDHRFANLRGEKPPGKGIRWDTP